MTFLRIATLAIICFAASTAFAKTVEVIEYRNVNLGHYFMTSDVAEVNALDSGQMPGWTRTGQKFDAYPGAHTGASPVCRYYIPPALGDSHFYSASAAECALAHSKFPLFQEESKAVFYIRLPDTALGTCAAGDTPVYRVWNNRADSSHRYPVDRALRDQMVAQGFIAEGYGPSQVIMCAPPHSDGPDPVGSSLPPPCTGNNPRVAVPNAPHGMYVWNPSQKLLPFLVKDVIGKDVNGNFKDPTLCGASLVIFWSSVETSKGVYDWSVITAAAKPFTDAGLTVNLLFSEATEGPVNTVTPAWVTAPVSSGGDGVPSVACAGQPTMPVYFDPTYEADWKAFIAAAINQFSYGNSPLAANVGYMRFATAGGAEALPPPGYNDGGACQAMWTAAGYSYDVWNTHEANIINAMGSVPTDKQIMVSLPNVSGGPNVYAVSNLGAAVAVAKNVGLSFENLGVSNVATATAPPGPCDPTAKIVNLHWCQAYTNYVGQVPLAMQPITATSNISQATMDISKLLQYALSNRIQIFELYPEEWLQADSPTSPGFVAANQAYYKAALQAASEVLGAANGR
jgi:hypothetical protein